MKKKLNLASIIIMLSSLIVMFLITYWVVVNNTNKNAEKEIKNYLNIASEIYNGTNHQELADSFDSFNIRITIIDESGKVIFDNVQITEENHLSRPEIQNLGKCVYRYSDTKKIKYLYIACKDNGDYIRLAIPQKNIHSIVLSFGIYGSISLVIIGAISIVINNSLIKKYTKPIEKEIIKISNLVDGDIAVANDDIEILSKNINEVQTLITNKMNEIKKEKEKNEYIIEYMQQGFILIDEFNNVKMINSQAKFIFETDNQSVIGKNYIYAIRNIELQQLINKCLKEGCDGQYEFSYNDRYYIVSIKPIFNTKYINYNAVAVYIYDDTLRHNTVIMKQEFFANASHELKSPLTSIIGYQQMINEGILETEDEIKDANKKTIEEAKRMNEMILDMLEISRLESEVEDNKEEIDLQDTIKQIVKSFEIIAQNKNIKFELSLQTLISKISSKDATYLFRNLIENAIKYGKEHGYVKITINEKKVCIEDNGIGISEENQTRVFERFYQVSKNRNKSISGTGLGLSIVKKICQKNNIDIQLISSLNKGTKIILHFNK